MQLFKKELSHCLKPKYGLVRWFGKNIFFCFVVTMVKHILWFIATLIYVVCFCRKITTSGMLWKNTMNMVIPMYIQDMKFVMDIKSKVRIFLFFYFKKKSKIKYQTKFNKAALKVKLQKNWLNSIEILAQLLCQF